MSFYKTLGIPNNATIQDAKDAYRELAKKHHPDTKDGDANKFREISEAYEHLGNETKKHKYDTAMSMSNGMGDDFLEAFRNSTDFASMFDGVFGTRAKGPDIRISIQLTLFDVYYGSEKLIDTGVSRFTLKIPKGISNGTNLKLSGKGGVHQMNSNAPKGDMIVTCYVLPSTDIIVNGSDIWVDVDLPFYDLLLGTSITIRNQFYVVMVDVPKGSYVGKVLRIGGKGIPIYKSGGYGNLMVRLNSTVPNLNEEQNDLLEKIRNIDKI